MDQRVKTCSSCREVLPSTQFYRRGEHGLQHNCKQCSSRLSRDRYKRNPDQMWGANLRSKYGITPEEYTRMLEEQGGVCAICREAPTRNSGHSRLSVDHDHETGRVRGLLCDHCNRLLGYAKDLTTTLERAIEYLK